MARNWTVSGSAVLVVLLTFVTFPAAAAPAEARNITSEFADTGFAIERLAVYEVGGIVVLRGRTYDRSVAAAAGIYAQALGYERIANLIQVLEQPNDEIIRRDAERELALHRALGGTRLSVESERGVVFLRGHVQHALQADLAVNVLRNVEGVREVRAEVQQD